jgi:multiple sugar transport system permease protein
MSSNASTVREGGGKSRIATLHKVLRSPQFWFGMTVLVPTFIAYWLFHFGPIVNAFRLAVLKYKILDPSGSRFVGLDNFRIIMDHRWFVISIRNTLVFTIFSFVLVLPPSMFIAVCLSRVTRGRNLYQGLIFVPFIVSLLAISLLFRMILDPEVGQMNQLLRSLNLPESRWLSDTTTALPTLASIASWKRLGFYVVLFTAGILNVPQELYDAALVDGANEWQRFWKITLPLLSRTMALVVVLLAIATLQTFTEPYVMTEGGPANATRVYNMLIYSEAFEDLRFGTAAAASLLQFVFILVVSVIQLKVIQPKWSY